ncbi:MULTISPECIES: menaquinone-dependent protoporphyrinogen IX dehydrogenase [Tatumella]|uniref:Protoporphyrinogen IX dehydrogenase [quinone] n=1 Tax=Tatumella ptyseos ATCC 33301 TaxID=1005995 RepID=A0A085JL62_9GAMM|nr:MULTISPECIES: menaquinone-dependent protoporphyrinogen IX dehydrogenase [Tatumella]KFD21208.1 oxygen-independent protoporphyrinogen IX oxidase [Tatumella ptyseos ATCC 33301]
MKMLILFSSRDGQTRKIADFIANEAGEEKVCDVVNIDSASGSDWQAYDRVLIAASIRYGHYAPEVNRFIADHLPLLQSRASGFISVNLTARKADKNTPETNVYTRKFLEQSPWTPDRCLVAAGALRYPRYGWLDKQMIRLIMKMTGGETDTSKEYEYTDWQQVAEFAREFVQITDKSLYK